MFKVDQKVICIHNKLWEDSRIVSSNNWDWSITDISRYLDINKIYIIGRVKKDGDVYLKGIDIGFFNKERFVAASNNKIINTLIINNIRKYKVPIV